jgi:hypothetical protein
MLFGCFRLLGTGVAERIIGYGRSDGCAGIRVTNDWVMQ